MPYFEEEGKDDVIECFVPFKRIYSVTLSEFTYDSCIRRLENIEKVVDQIDLLDLCVKSAESLENMTEPEFFKDRVNLLKVGFIKTDQLTSKSINNYALI